MTRSPQNQDASPTIEGSCHAPSPPATKTSNPRDVTILIESWKHGDGEALNDLFTLTFDNLHDMARVQMNAELPGHTLQATALVSEVFLRLAAQSPDHLADRKTFYCTVARAMKQIRIEQARRRNTLKRGGDRKRVPLDLAIGGLARETKPDGRLLMLDQALDELADRFPEQHDLTLLLYCGGLNTEQAGEVLGIARRTAQRDWKFARAFLRAQMSRMAMEDLSLPATRH